VNPNRAMTKAIKEFMMQKISKTLMHVWISAVSLGAFVFSWVILAHTPKPSSSLALAAPTPRSIQAVVPSQPRLEPIPTLDNYLPSGSSQTQPTRKSRVIVQPRLRTRGS
jgi:hypothetical protein